MQIDGLLFFVIVIAIGYLVLRVRLVPESAADILPKVLLNVCFPAMLFSSFAAMEAKELLSVGIPTVLATLGFSLGVFAVAFFLFRNYIFARCDMPPEHFGKNETVYFRIHNLNVYVFQLLF